jgi:hypothetical protein
MLVERGGKPTTAASDAKAARDAKAEEDKAAAAAKK